VTCGRRPGSDRKIRRLWFNDTAQFPDFRHRPETRDLYCPRVTSQRPCLYNAPAGVLPKGEPGIADKGVQSGAVLVVYHHSGFSGGVSPSGSGTCATFNTIDTKL
jgi:hypothetical protein